MNNFGLCVSGRYFADLCTYLENEKIDYQIWTEGELLFATKEDRQMAQTWLRRLQKMDS